MSSVPPFDLYASTSGPHGKARLVRLDWTRCSVTYVIKYAVSYRYAASSLLAAMKERVRMIGADYDLTACPIVFLYRQSLELYLKAIVFRSVHLNLEDTYLSGALPSLWREHSLVRLFEMAAPLLDNLSSTFATDILGLRQEVSDLTQRLDFVDPDSYSFRYPITSNDISSPPRHLIMNILVFAEHSDAVLTHLNEFCTNYMQRVSVMGSAEMKRALAPIAGSSDSAI